MMNGSVMEFDILQQGLTFLQEDMGKYPSFDLGDYKNPLVDYPKKNDYFDRANNLGCHHLMERNLYPLAEYYFSACVQSMDEYKRKTGKGFNRGMVYANLGIAKMHNQKISSGIAHLLAAEKEDEPLNEQFRPDYDILNQYLWGQFEDQFIFPTLYELNNDSNADLGFKIDKLFLDRFFRQIDRQDRIFLQGTIWALKNELLTNKNTPNIYTWGRLYSILKDLCLITETMLRKKQAGKGQKSKKQTTLGKLLCHALKYERIGYPNQGANSANDVDEFLRNVEMNLNITDAKSRRIHFLHLVRNFTGHHFELGDGAVSPSGKTFFNDLYPKTLTNVLAAIMYLENISAF